VNAYNSDLPRVYCVSRKDKYKNIINIIHESLGNSGINKYNLFSIGQHLVETQISNQLVCYGTVGFGLGHILPLKESTQKVLTLSRIWIGNLREGETGEGCRKEAYG
jgi:hypothetical protein